MTDAEHADNAGQGDDREEGEEDGEHGFGTDKCQLKVSRSSPAAASAMRYKVDRSDEKLDERDHAP